MNAPLLQAVDLGKRFGAVVAAADINVSVRTGERVSLIGSNGAGKTTLVNMITGYLKPDAGRIHFEGKEITGRVVRTIRRGETIFDDTLQGFERMTARPGSGRFLRRGYGETT